MLQIGRFLVTLGIFFLILGGLIMVLGTLPRFPGDIYVHRKGFTLYVPILGSILVSIIFTLLLNLFFARR